MSVRGVQGCVHVWGGGEGEVGKTLGVGGAAVSKSEDVWFFHLTNSNSRNSDVLLPSRGTMRYSQAA